MKHIWDKLKSSYENFGCDEETGPQKGQEAKTNKCEHRELSSSSRQFSNSFHEKCWFAERRLGADVWSALLTVLHLLRSASGRAVRSERGWSEDTPSPGPISVGCWKLRGGTTPGVCVCVCLCSRSQLLICSIFPQKLLCKFNLKPGSGIYSIAVRLVCRMFHDTSCLNWFYPHVDCL